MSKVYKPRNDFVLVRVIDLGQLRGIHVPNISVEGKKYVVEAMGDAVKNLKVGDSVLMTGTVGVDWATLPGLSDLLIIKEANIVLVIEEDRECDPKQNANPHEVKVI